jgi:adenylate kinase
MSVTLVSGVPGVGASTVAAEAVSELDDHRLFNFGDAMLEAAVAQGIAESRDELSGLSASERGALQRYAAGYVRDEASKGPVVVTTSFVVRLSDGYLPGLPDPVLHEMGPDRLVVVEAEPSTVAERREGDDYRDYPEPTESGIRFHQRMNRTAAFVYSARSSATVHHVPNEGGVEKGAEKLAAILGEGV